MVFTIIFYRHSNISLYVQVRKKLIMISSSFVNVRCKCSFPIGIIWLYRIIRIIFNFFNDIKLEEVVVL